MIKLWYTFSYIVIKKNDMNSTWSIIDINKELKSCKAIFFLERFVVLIRTDFVKPIHPNTDWWLVPVLNHIRFWSWAPSCSSSACLSSLAERAICFCRRRRLVVVVLDLVIPDDNFLGLPLATRANAGLTLGTETLKVGKPPALTTIVKPVATGSFSTNDCSDWVGATYRYGDRVAEQTGSTLTSIETAFSNAPSTSTLVETDPNAWCKNSSKVSPAGGSDVTEETGVSLDELLLLSEKSSSEFRKPDRVSGIPSNETPDNNSSSEMPDLLDPAQSNGWSNSGTWTLADR